MTTLDTVLNLVQLVSLIVITGGTITIGALTAPTLFNSLSREEAGSVMFDLFAKFDNWIKFSAIILFVAKLLQLILVHKFNFFITTGTGEELVKSFNTPLFAYSLLAVIITAVTLYLTNKLSPEINASYENDLTDFAALHKKSEQLHKLNFVLGLVLLSSFA